MIKIDIRTLPPKNPKITLRRIFGEEGSAGTVASSKVVTSETFVTSMIFSAAILRKALAMRAASSGLSSLTVIETIRVSAGTETVM